MKQLELKKVLASLAVLSIILIAGCNSKPKEFHEGLAAVEKDGKWGYVDTLNNVVIPFRYDSVGHFSGGAAYVHSSGKLGIIDAAGNEIVPCKYDNIGQFEDGIAIIGNGGKYGFVDAAGNEIIPLLYENVEPFVDGRATVIQNGNTFLIDKSGKRVFTEEQEYVAEISFEKSKKTVVTIRLSADLKQVVKMKLSSGGLYLTYKGTKYKYDKYSFIGSKDATIVTTLNNSGIESTTLKGGVENEIPIDVTDNQIALNNVVECDLTVTGACIYGNIKIRIQGCETKSVYVVLKNATTPQEIPEEIVNGK